MIQSKTLYSLDKKGNPLLWTIKWDDEDNWYTMSSGRVDGSITETKPTYCKGKNIGKANETTDVTQCQADVKSRIEKQRKKDFHDTIPEQKRFEVTLAKEFNARKKFIKFPMLLSAKLDGFRCYITKDGMFSRTHHKIVSCPHIFEEIEEIFHSFGDMVIDGELYSHELREDFNKVASLISRTKNLDESFLEETKSIIKFHVFDWHQLSNPMKYNKRCNMFIKDKENFKFLENLTTNEGSVFDNFVVVNQVQVNSFDDVESFLDKAIGDGFEGIMLRDPEMFYDEGRSSNLIKYKRFEDAEYKVVDIQDGVGNHAGQASIIVCEDKNGTRFSAGTGKGWDEKAKKQLFENKDKYIGKMATIVYQELTPDENVPRFGKLKAFRD